MLLLDFLVTDCELNALASEMLLDRGSGNGSSHEMGFCSSARERKLRESINHHENEETKETFFHFSAFLSPLCLWRAYMAAAAAHTHTRIWWCAMRGGQMWRRQRKIELYHNVAACELSLSLRLTFGDSSRVMWKNCLSTFGFIHWAWRASQGDDMWREWSAH
jgi:cold shock CspA family protein